MIKDVYNKVSCVLQDSVTNEDNMLGDKINYKIHART